MKHALVTGASRGIGLHIAVELLNQNFRITGTARSTGFPDALLAHRHFKGIHTDLADLSSLFSSLKPLVEKDLPDVLVNNAGIFRRADFLVSDDEWIAAWDETMQVNLRASSLSYQWRIVYAVNRQ